MDRFIIGMMQMMMLFALYLAGRSMNFGQWYYAGIVAAGLLFLWQQWLIRKREPANCLRAFQNNNYVGMVIFVGIMLDHLYGA
jgi:4-hydroxybenzoate polyprenyltransferase